MDLDTLTDAGQRLIPGNLDSLARGSANIALTLKKGQQQYSTPLIWASRFARQLPCQGPRTAIDWQCGTGNLLEPLFQARHRFGVDVDKRFEGQPAGQHGVRIVDSCLTVWDLLEEFFPKVRFECQVVNPPFGLPWVAPDFRMGRATSTAVTWKRVQRWAAEGGFGYFIAGRKQLEAIGIHKHPWAYLYQTFPGDFFPGTDIEIGVVHWINAPHPALVHQAFTTTDPDEHPILPEPLLPVLQEPKQNWEESHATSEAFYRCRDLIAEDRAGLPPFHITFRRDVLRVTLPLRFQLHNAISGEDLATIMAIDGQHPLTLIHEVRTRRVLRDVVKRGIFTISPDAAASIREALEQATRMATPIMPVTDFERVAYVDELDLLKVRADFNPADYNHLFRFTAGSAYPHATGTYRFVQSFQRQRIHYNAETEETFTVVHDCDLSGQDRYVSVKDNWDTEHRFMDRPGLDPDAHPWKEHPEHLLWHIFERPDVPTVAEDMPERYLTNRTRLLQMADTMTTP